jgi:hypothetical protein
MRCLMSSPGLERDLPLRAGAALSFFEDAADGGRAYPHRLFPDVRRDAEGRAEDGEGHLLTHKGGQEPQTFVPAALMPEETPDEAEGGGGFASAGFLPFRLAGLFLDSLTLAVLPFATSSTSAVSGLFSIRRAYFRFLRLVVLTNPSRMADFSFCPVFL